MKLDDAIMAVIALAVIAATALALLSLTTGSAVTQGSKVSAGSAAPAFSLENLEGKATNLADYRGKTVVLFFNEGAMCYPSCWNQMKELSADPRLNNGSVASFSIVVDTPSEWKKITSSVQGFSPQGLLFDTTKEVSKEYGALAMQSSMHSGIMPGHTYYIIDKNGTLRFVFDDPQMGVRNDMIAQEIAKLE